VIDQVFPRGLRSLIPRIESVRTEVGPADHPWACEFLVEDQYAGYSMKQGKSVNICPHISG